MYGLYRGNPGSKILNFLVGYGLSNRGVGGHTYKRKFKHYKIIPGFIMWSIYCYNILNLTEMLILDFMHRFGFELMYGGQKIGIMTVF